MKIYFAGSIRGGRENQLYCKTAIDEISKYATVLTEHVGDVNLTATGEDKSELYIYERDMAWLKEADAIIAEVTSPSLGVGYEVAYAESWGKPVLCICKGSEKTLSAMIVGASENNHSVIKVRYYQEAHEIAKIIKDFISQFDN